MEPRLGIRYYLLPHPLEDREVVVADGRFCQRLLQRDRQPLPHTLYIPQGEVGKDLARNWEEGLKRDYQGQAQGLVGRAFIWLGLGLGMSLTLGRFLFQWGYGGIAELFQRTPWVSQYLIGVTLTGGALGGFILALLPLGLSLAKAFSLWGRARERERWVRGLEQLRGEELKVEASPPLARFWEEARELNRLLRNAQSQLLSTKAPGERKAICLQMGKDLERLFRLSRLHGLDDAVSSYYYGLHSQVSLMGRRGKR